MDQLWQAVMQDTLPVLAVLTKGVTAAVVVGGLADATVKYLLAPVLASDSVPISPLTHVGERMAILVLSQGAVVAAHGLDIWTYGTGPKGYGAAVLFGFLGGGLAPKVREMAAAKFGAKP